MEAFAHSWLLRNKLQSGWHPDRGRGVCRRASLGRFLTISASFCRNSLVTLIKGCSSFPGGWSQTIWEVKLLDVEVVGRWVACKLQLWGRLVENRTFRSQAAALVGTPAVCMPVARSLRTETSVLCNKTVHFKGAFYSGQLKVHLCNNHAASSYAKPVRWLVYPSREALTKTDADKFVINIWERSSFCMHWKFYICGSIWCHLMVVRSDWLGPCSPDIIHIIFWVTYTILVGAQWKLI